jgi:hypothetical protein
MIQEENKPCSEAAFRWLVFRIFDIKWQKSIFLAGKKIMIV